MSETTDPQLPGNPGRPSKKQLDEREAALAEREAALDSREEQMNAPRVSLSEDQHGKGENTKSDRRSMQHGKKFPDVRPYQDHYPGKQFVWVNDVNGEVQRWIDVGAEPVPVLVNKRRQFEGITDRADSQWVRIIGGSYEGSPFYVYFMMMSPEIYDSEKLAPVRERQKAIKDAMAIGRDQSDTGSGLKSYAPNLPSGGRGYEETHEVAGT